MLKVNQIIEKLGFIKISRIENLKNDISLLKKIRNELKVSLNESEQKKVSLEKQLLQKNIDIENLRKKLNKFSRFKKPKWNKLNTWVKIIKKTNICDCCLSSDVPLQAHHLWSKSLHPSLATELTNGVALCVNCHSSYHAKFINVEDCNPSTYQEFKTCYLKK